MVSLQLGFNTGRFNCKETIHHEIITARGAIAIILEIISLTETTSFTINISHKSDVIQDTSCRLQDNSS